MRVVSGKFQRGMKVKVARSGRTVALSRPQRMFAQDRSTVQEGFAGDVIGLSNPGAFAVGDTIYAGALGRRACLHVYVRVKESLLACTRWVLCSHPWHCRPSPANACTACSQPAPNC